MAFTVLASEYGIYTQIGRMEGSAINAKQSLKQRLNDSVELRIYQHTTNHPPSDADWKNSIEIMTKHCEIAHANTWCTTKAHPQSLEWFTVTLPD